MCTCTCVFGTRERGDNDMMRTVRCIGPRKTSFDYVSWARGVLGAQCGRGMDRGGAGDSGPVMLPLPAFLRVFVNPDCSRPVEVNSEP